MLFDLDGITGDHPIQLSLRGKLRHGGDGVSQVMFLFSRFRENSFRTPGQEGAALIKTLPLPSPRSLL